MREKERVYIGMPAHLAVMFMNSNKVAINICGIIQENRQKCGMAGITLMHECVVSKGADRDIDREAVNVLISLLLTGRYDTVVVERLTDITGDLTDLEEFMHDAASIGIGFFEVSTMQYYVNGRTGTAL